MVEVSCSSQLCLKSFQMMIQKYASLLLAKAVAELIPGARFLSFGADGVLFHCEWESASPVDDTLLLHLEEKVREGARVPISFRFQEMIATNAAAYLSSRGQPYLADEALEIEDKLVTLAIADPFLGPVAHPFEVPAPFALRLVSLDHTEGAITVTGVAASVPASVKEYVKVYKNLQNVSVDKVLLAGKYLWQNPEGEFCFLSSGLKLREKFKRYFDKVNGAAMQPVDIPMESMLDAVETLKKLLELTRRGPLVCWGRNDDLLLNKFSWDDGKQFVKSSLQLFEKTAKILGFESQKVLVVTAPAFFMKNKEARARWKKVSDFLLDGLKEENIPFVQSEELEAESGPYFEVQWSDKLERTLSGSRLTFVCLDDAASKEELLLARELFPDWGALLHKLGEEGSIDNVEAELRKELES